MEVRKALLEVQEELRGLPGRLVSIGRNSRRYGWGRDALPKVRKAFPKVQEGSRGLSGGLGGVERRSWRFRRNRESLSGSERVGRPSRRSEWGQEALPKVHEGSEDPFRGPEGVGKPSQRSRRRSQRSRRRSQRSRRRSQRSRRPSQRSRRRSQRSGKGREEFPEVREGSRSPSGGLESLPRSSRGVMRPS